MFVIPFLSHSYTQAGKASFIYEKDHVKRKGEEEEERRKGRETE